MDSQGFGPGMASTPLHDRMLVVPPGVPIASVLSTNLGWTFVMCYVLSYMLVSMGNWDSAAPTVGLGKGTSSVTMPCGPLPYHVSAPKHHNFRSFAEK